MEVNKFSELSNLEKQAAENAQEVLSGIETSTGDRETKSHEERVKAIENLATKALGVLQENGVYAYFLFLCSRPQAEQGRVAIIRKSLTLLESLPFGWKAPLEGCEPAAIQRFVSEHVLKTLERNIIAKGLLEQMLIFVRYGAKAARAGGNA